MARRRGIFNIGRDEHETSNPSPHVENVRDEEGASLGVQDNANLAHFDEEPPVFNDTPAEKKSYAWNRGEEGNANSGGNGGGRERERRRNGDEEERRRRGREED